MTGMGALLNGLLQNASAQSKRVNNFIAEISRLNQQETESEALAARSASAAENLLSYARRRVRSVSQFVL